MSTLGYEYTDCFVIKDGMRYRCLPIQGDYQKFKCGKCTRGTIFAAHWRGDRQRNCRVCHSEVYAVRFYYEGEPHKIKNLKEFRY